MTEIDKLDEQLKKVENYCIESHAKCSGCPLNGMRAYASQPCFNAFMRDLKGSMTVINKWEKANDKEAIWKKVQDKIATMSRDEFIKQFEHVEDCNYCKCETDEECNSEGCFESIFKRLEQEVSNERL